MCQQSWRKICLKAVYLPWMAISSIRHKDTCIAWKFRLTTQEQEKNFVFNKNCIMVTNLLKWTIVDESMGSMNLLISQTYLFM